MLSGLVCKHRILALPYSYTKKKVNGFTTDDRYYVNEFVEYLITVS